MTTWPTHSHVNNVPEIIHLSPVPRLSPHELLRFDKMMQVADVTATAALDVRKRQRQSSHDSPCAIGPPQSGVQLSFGESDDEDDEGVAPDKAIARALIKTIAATTGATVPECIKTTHQAIAWTSKAILDSRTAAITSTRRERNNYSLNPDQALQAMQLINNLNELLSAPARPAERMSELPYVAPSL